MCEPFSTRSSYAVPLDLTSTAMAWTHHTWAVSGKVGVTDGRSKIDTAGWGVRAPLPSPRVACRRSPISPPVSETSAAYHRRSVSAMLWGSTPCISLQTFNVALEGGSTDCLLLWVQRRSRVDLGLLRWRTPASKSSARVMILYTLGGGGRIVKPESGLDTPQMQPTTAMLAPVVSVAQRSCSGSLGTSSRN